MIRPIKITNERYYFSIRITYEGGRELSTSKITFEEVSQFLKNKLVEAQHACSD